jgi:NADH-quinone oxidoreductase subunit J
MVGVAALFVTLGAYFIAGVQLIVYAGAVMVLFVMVLMLFDLKQEVQAFTKGKISGVLKLMTIGVLAGLIIGAIKTSLVSEVVNKTESQTTVDNTREIAQLLFTQYLFGFEALGVLLLVVAVGAVALARSKGGTHAKS